MNDNFVRELSMEIVLYIMSSQGALIKATMRHHQTPTRRAKIRKTKRASGKDLEQQEPSHSAGGKPEPTLENTNLVLWV